MEQNANQTTPDSRLSFAGSLMYHAKLNNEEALKIMFKQFLPPEETIIHAEYYGYFGFSFVGFHSFSCLTDKRISALRVGPFKKVVYEDGFYENMTSGGIFQPSKFWLYVFLAIGLPAGFVMFTAAIAFILNYLLVYIFSLYELSQSTEILVFSGILSLFLVPFIGSFITMAFYRANPCGLACWVRERYPVYVFVNREKMTRANKLFRIWSTLREERNKYIKGKYK